MKLNINEQVELTINPEWQTQPFTVTGIYESVQPIAEHIQALDAQDGRRSRVSRKLGTSSLEAPKAAIQGAVGRAATVLQVAAYDYKYGTSFAAEIKQRKADARDMRMARRLGLLSNKY